MAHHIKYMLLDRAHKYYSRNNMVQIKPHEITFEKHSKICTLHLFVPFSSIVTRFWIIVPFMIKKQFDDYEAARIITGELCSHDKLRMGHPARTSHKA